MDMIGMLADEKVWREFYDYKLSEGHLNKAEQKALAAFIDGREYMGPVQEIQDTLALSHPVVKEINKTGTQKKRTVFSFGRPENYILKLLTFLLRKYDHLFSDNLYSFRKETGVKKAVYRSLRGIDYAHVYSYKADIHDYFNSADRDIIISTLRGALGDEPRTLTFIENIISDPYAVKNGEVVAVHKGMMAGVPFSGFLANLYLKDMDEWFAQNNIRYIRYSDDIIVFADNAQDIARYGQTVRQYLTVKKLEVNPQKEVFTRPGDSVEYLGFSFSADEIRISGISVKKIKDKLKRKSKALYRWRVCKGAEGSKAAKAYIRFLNRKFYDNPVSGEITWCRWYFPVITSDAALKEIDEYAVSCIRFLYTGNHGKKNYNVRYDEIKALGFRSLVNSFWRFQNGTYDAGDLSGQRSPD